MKVLICASEGAPYAKTGGLADVIGALPAALKENGCDVRIIMPYYKKIKAQQIAYYKGYAYVRIGAKMEYVGIFHAIHEGIDYYFIDNDYYFNDSGALQTGWVKREYNAWDYSAGPKAKITEWCYANSSGVLQSGWQKISGSWYYFDPEWYGMATGVTEIGKKAY